MKIKDKDCGNWGQKPSLLYVYVHIKNINFRVKVKINSFLAILSIV